jgi:hypothetical protein
LVSWWILVWGSMCYYSNKPLTISQQQMPNTTPILSSLFHHLHPPNGMTQWKNTLIQLLGGTWHPSSRNEHWGPKAWRRQRMKCVKIKREQEWEMDGRYWTTGGYTDFWEKCWPHLHIAIPTPFHLSRWFGLHSAPVHWTRDLSPFLSTVPVPAGNIPPDPHCSAADPRWSLSNKPLNSFHPFLPSIFLFNQIWIQNTRFMNFPNLKNRGLQLLPCTGSRCWKTFDINN